MAQAPDVDADGVPDASDNCPVVANITQHDADADDLGDACEAFPSTYDSEDDGYSDLNEAGSPMCVGIANGDAMDDGPPNDGCPSFEAPKTACSDAADDDGDARPNDGCPQIGAFAEGQFRIGTNHLARCGVGASPFLSSAWPSDFVSGGVPQSTDKITITDLTSIFFPPSKLNSSPGDPKFIPRWDLSPGPGVLGAWINIADMTALLKGPGGYPPMSGGTRVFASAFTCTAHPVYGD